MFYCIPFNVINVLFAKILALSLFSVSRMVVGDLRWGDDYVRMDSEIQNELWRMLEDPGCGTTEEVKQLRILHQGTMNYKFKNHCLMCLMCLKCSTYIYI